MKMQTPPLRNTTTAKASLFPLATMSGWSVLVVIKQRFEIGRDGQLRALRDAKIRPADEPWSKDARSPSSIKYPHDLAPTKPTTDIVVVGDAISPGARPVRTLEVRVEVGDVARSLRVFGPRTWYDAGARYAPTDPAQFTTAAIRWENAFGGTDATDAGAALEEPRNPIGRGLIKDATRLAGQLVPQIEDPADPIQSHRSRPPPAGLGAIGPNFAPRRSLAGTYDAAWVRQRMPLPPADMDDRFHQCAPPELQSRVPLRGGEPVRLLGLHRDGLISFSLPQRLFRVAVPAEGALEEKAAVMDTVLLEPNARQMEISWRVCVPWLSRRRRHAPIEIRSTAGAP